MDRIDAAFTRMRVFPTAFLALTMLAGPAVAQRAERPDVKVGDRWEFVLYYGTPSAQPNRSWVITSVSSTTVEGMENGEPLLLTPDLNVRDSPLRTESNPNALRFPLEAGKRWQYASDWVFKPLNSSGRLDVDVTVVRHERVIVLAGTYCALKIESNGRLSGMSSIGSHFAGEIVTTYWYSPAARAIVKSVSRNPYLGTSTVELVDMAHRLEPGAKHRHVPTQSGSKSPFIECSIEDL